VIFLQKTFTFHLISLCPCWAYQGHKLGRQKAAPLVPRYAAF